MFWPYELQSTCMAPLTRNVGTHKNYAKCEAKENLYAMVNKQPH